MSKYLLVIADYPAPKQEIFDNQISPRNKEFAEQHGYEYIVSKGGPFVRNSGHWRCFTLPNTMINDGTLKEGDTLLILEAMKMENTITSPKDAIIKSITIKSGETVEKGQLMIELN